jgi:phycobilisome core-membrane linker protein
VKGGLISAKEFIRRLGKSRQYRQDFYEPFTISRVIELAVGHFLGRGLYSIEEFQTYFDVISRGGLAALIDALVDSAEYSDYFGEQMIPYRRGLGQEAQECRNWGAQLELFKFSAVAQKIPQFITLFGSYRQPLPNQHAYGASHDALEIQFGAIFDQPHRLPTGYPACFNNNHRRILINCGNDNSNGHSNANNHANHQAQNLGRVPGAIAHPLKFRTVHLGDTINNPNFSGSLHSPEAVILAAYRQMWGGSGYAGQRLTAAESKLRSGEITLREFIRQLGKSRLFRQHAWESLYITKAIEYIHRRLLGRPTYGREELSQYYDLCARQGFYALIDALVDSAEYLTVFGEETVPYERYITPRGLTLRTPHGSSDSWQNGFAGSSRHPVANIPTVAVASTVSEGGQAWPAMMQVASQRSLLQSNQPTLPGSATVLVAELMSQYTDSSATTVSPVGAGAPPTGPS